MTDTYIKVRVSGALACFSRPEMKVERVSYEVMTPSAARGVLDSILWKPQMRWVVHRISVLKPIRFLSVRRNEIQSKVVPTAVKEWMQDPTKYEPQAAGAGSNDVTPRNTLALRDVAYLIEARPLVFQVQGDETPTKYMAMFNRRVEHGQCFNRPYLGCREFAADFASPNPDERPISDSADLGMMLYDVVFRGAGTGNKAVFFKAELRNGVVDTVPERVLADAKVREEVLACSSKP